MGILAPAFGIAIGLPVGGTLAVAVVITGFAGYGVYTAASKLKQRF